MVWAGITPTSPERGRQILTSTSSRGTGQGLFSIPAPRILAALHATTTRTNSPLAQIHEREIQQSALRENMQDKWVVYLVAYEQGESGIAQIPGSPISNKFNMP
jgi:hypothetical protein